MKRFTCDPATRDALNGVSDKLAWATLLETILTADRLIECKRDANGNAADPWVSGVTFRKLRSEGDFTKMSGTIIKLGTLHTQTVKTSADMFSGVSVMRISRADGTRWIQGMMGPSKAAQNKRGTTVGQEQEFDFEVDGNFTTKNGFGVKANLSISGARFLNSGVGSGTPGKLDNMPHIMEVFNLTNPASPTLAGSCTLDTRLDNWVYEDEEMALENGDAAIYQASQLVPFGEFDFAPTLIVVDQHNSAPGNVQMWECIVAARVSPQRTTWSTYPEMDTFDPAQHVTIPNAFKVVIKDKNNNVLYTHQMHGGEAINYKRFYYGSWNETTPMQPPWNTGMWLGCRNVMPRLSSRANKWYPGMEDRARRPSRAKQQWTAIGVEPLWNGGYGNNSANGMHAMYCHKKWPGVRGFNQRDQPEDPYMSDPNNGTARYWAWMDGWGYEPGSISGHNWYTGPGGPRFDRAPIPSILALWASMPDGVRLEGNVPLAEQAHNWSLAYLNHSNHWVKDPRTLQLAANNFELMYDWDTAGNYYGDSGQSGPKSIDTRGNMREDVQPRHLDKNGQLFWSGWARDGLHSYGNANWAAILMNSPMMAIAGKFDTFWECQRGAYQGRGDYMVRNQAWRWMTLCLAWKTASKHPLGVQRELIERLAVGHLEGWWEQVYVPVYLQNENSPFANGLRNLGQPIKTDDGVSTQGGALGMYMAGVLALWKQTGFWSRMYHYNDKCRLVLEMQLKHMDKYCFDYTLDTAMENWPTTWIDLNNISSWGAVHPKNLLSDATHNDDGSVRGGDRDVSVHPFSMYPFVRKYYFPEFPHPRLDATVAKWNSMLDAVSDVVAAQPNPEAKRNRDHGYGYPGVAIWKAPANGLLGPA